MTVAQAKAVLTAATNRLNHEYARLVATVGQTSPHGLSQWLKEANASVTSYVQSLQSHHWPSVAASDVQQAVTDMQNEFSDMEAMSKDPNSQAGLQTFLGASLVAHNQLDRVRKDLGLPPLPPL
jgi:hypothetical protein